MADVLCVHACMRVCFRVCVRVFVCVCVCACVRAYRLCLCVHQIRLHKDELKEEVFKIQVQNSWNKAHKLLNSWEKEGFVPPLPDKQAAVPYTEATPQTPAH